MKILLFVFALWAFMYIAPSDGKQVRRYHGNCNKGEFWLIRIKCTNKCKIGKPKAIFRKKGRVSITGRVGKAFTQKKRLCGKNCFCMKRSKNNKNQVTCKRTKKINSNRVHFDIRCIKKTTRLRFQANIKNIKPRIKPCATGEKRHEDGVCRKCENGKYHDGTTCQACACNANGAKFQSCETGTGFCKCNAGYEDKNCDQCAYGFFKRPGTQVCSACNCDPVGSNALACSDNSGNCNCKAGFKKPKCKDCKDGFFYNAGTSSCDACNCVLGNTVGGNDKTCNNSKKCNCQPSFSANDCSS